VVPVSTITDEDGVKEDTDPTLMVGIMISHQAWRTRGAEARDPRMILES